MTDPQAILLKLTNNLNTLKEREAKYAGNTPLDLLNQIADHEEAIDLTKQAIADQISLEAWRVALKPLLVTLDQTQTYIDQSGQTIDGDQYNAGRDMNIHYHKTPAPHPPLQRPPRAQHFTGREQELAQLLTDLQPGEVVTLTGPGGIGKSALAAEASWTLAPTLLPQSASPMGLSSIAFMVALTPPWPLNTSSAALTRALRK